MNETENTPIYSVQSKKKFGWMGWCPQPNIIETKCIKHDHKWIYFDGCQVPRKTEACRYFETYDEAKNFLVYEYTSRIKNMQKHINEAEKVMEKVNKL